MRSGMAMWIMSSERAGRPDRATSAAVKVRRTCLTRPRSSFPLLSRPTSFAEKPDRWFYHTDQTEQATTGDSHGMGDPDIQ